MRNDLNVNEKRRMKNLPSILLARITWACLACCLLCGCLSTKDITYFQAGSPKRDEVVKKMETAYTPVIKPGDVLSISVNSLDKDDREVFNPLPAVVTQQAQIGGFIVLQPIRGFTVNEAGVIDFPQVGTMQVVGLTTEEVELKLTGLLQEYIKSPTVSVYIANYFISIVGEVARPAQYVIPHNRITLPEALALAGDLTIYGKRTNVLVIRELDGKRTFARVNLTDRSLFNSPYYYLQSGDYIYVEPGKGKLTSSDRTYQIAPIIISSLSFLLLIINTITK